MDRYLILAQSAAGADALERSLDVLLPPPLELRGFEAVDATEEGAIRARIVGKLTWAYHARPENGDAQRLRLNILIMLDRWSEARVQAEALLDSPYAEFEHRLWADAALIAGALGRHDPLAAMGGRWHDAPPNGHYVTREKGGD